MSCDEKKLIRLIAKYYEGNTSLDEENTLKELFASGDYPKSMAVEAYIFGATKNATSKSLGSISEEIISKALVQSRSRAIRLRRVAIWSTAWAASLALLLAISWLYLKQPVEEKIVDTFTDPDIAYQETQKVLAFIGSKFDKAQSELQVMQRIDEPSARLLPMGELSRGIDHLGMMKGLEKPNEIPLIKHIFENFAN